MRIAVIAGCLATALGGFAVAAHFQARPGLPENRASAALSGRVDVSAVRYAYHSAATLGAAAPDSFVVHVRREAFLGEISPDEACALQAAGEGNERGERWKACMSRFTGRQVKQ